MKLKELREETVCKFWIRVSNETDCAGNRLFPMLSDVALAMLTLPMSNAAVERVFSQVTLTKTDLRNRMGIDTLENVLHVKYGLRRNGKCCCTDFQPSEAFFEKFTSDVMYAKECESFDD